MALSCIMKSCLVIYDISCVYDCIWQLYMRAIFPNNPAGNNIKFRISTSLYLSNIRFVVYYWVPRTILLPVVPARGGAEVALKIYIRPFSSIELACAVRQPSPCVRALCETGVLFHMSHFKLHFTLHTWQSSHSTLHTALFTLHSSRCTLRSQHFTSHCTLKTPLPFFTTPIQFTIFSCKRQ